MPRIRWTSPVKNSAEKFYGGTVYQTPQGTLFGLRPVGSADSIQRERDWTT